MAFPHYRLDIIERGGARKDLICYIYLDQLSEQKKNNQHRTTLRTYDLSNTLVVFYTVPKCKYVYIYISKCVVSYSQQQLQSMTTSFFPNLAVVMY